MRAIKIFSIPRYRLSPADLRKKLHGKGFDYLHDFYVKNEEKAELRKLSTVRQRVKKASLIPKKEGVRTWEVLFRYDLAQKLPSMDKGEKIYKKVLTWHENECWLRLRSELFLVFDMAWGPLTTQVGNLISAALFGKLGFVEPMIVSRKQFEELEKIITSKDHDTPGRITRSIFEDVAFGDSMIDELNLRCDSLSKIKAYREAARHCKYWEAMTFTTPLYPSFSRPLTCRISSHGSLLVYTPRILKPELEALVRIIELAVGRGA